MKVQSDSLHNCTVDHRTEASIFTPWASKLRTGQVQLACAFQLNNYTSPLVALTKQSHKIKLAVCKLIEFLGLSFPFSFCVCRIPMVDSLMLRLSVSS